MKILTATLMLAGSLSFAITAIAGTDFDQDVTPEVIFGDGNDNGSFTTHRRKGIEVGLRAKLRFPKMNTFNSNGDGTYSYPAGDACPGFSFSPTCLTTPEWSFEWSVNTDYDGSTGKTIGDYTYELGLDADPSECTNFTVFDNITPSLVAPAFDHAFGDNGTANGEGISAFAPPFPAYGDLLAGYNVAQNSWNYEFFNNLGTSLEFFDPSVDGNYVIYLKVIKNGRKTVAESKIQLLVGDASAIDDDDDSDSDGACDNDGDSDSE